VDDELLDDLKGRLAQASVWKVLDTSAELLLAMRGQGPGLYSEVVDWGAGRASFAGDLADVQPSELLNFIHQGRRTGVLLARAGAVERALVFVDGNIAWARSTSPPERLAGVGEVFLGFLVARAGSFAFLNGVDRAALPSALSLDTQAMLLDGLRRLDEMELYRTRIPSPQVVPRPTGKPPDGVEPQEKQILALADGKRTLAELAVASALGEFETTKAAYALIERGLLAL
jgi:hypothetical protein